MNVFNRFTLMILILCSGNVLAEKTKPVAVNANLDIFNDTKSCFVNSQENVDCYYEIPEGKILIVEAVNGNTERGPLERLYFRGRIDDRNVFAHIIPDNQLQKPGGTIYSGPVTLYLSSSQAFVDPDGFIHDFTATSIVDTTNASGRILGPSIIGRLIPMSDQ